MYYLMLIYTFLLSLKTSWTYNNFTYLSYQKDLRIHYLLWIMIISCFLLYKINKLFKKITYLSPLNKTLIIFSFLSVIIGSFLPYHPDNENIILSSFGALLLLVILQLLINRIMLIDSEFYQKTNILFHRSLLILSMFIIMFGTINSIIELFLIFTVLILLNMVEKHFL